MFYRNVWLNWLAEFPKNISRYRPGGRRKVRCAPEVLENRTLLTAYVVNTLSDNTTADGLISLREAIDAARTNAAIGDAPAGSGVGTDTISFDPSLNGGTITLNGTQLEIGGGTTINGPGAQNLTISGNAASRIFNIAPNTGTVTIVGLTLTNGAAEDGAAVYTSGTNLIVLDVNFLGNHATRWGGALFGDGPVEVRRSTFAENTAADGGGAFSSFSHSALFVNTTFSGNSALDEGGALWPGGPTTIINSTIVGNRANSDGIGENNRGGGIEQFDGNTLILHNTIVAGNFAGSGTAAHDILGTVDAVSSNNLIGDAASAGGLVNGTDGNIVGVNGFGVRDINTVIDINLLNNGGTTLTHNLVGGSPAINSGSDARANEFNVTVDQRVFNRFVGTVDMGAIEAPLDDHGDNAATATEIMPGAVGAGWQLPGDRDVFSFTAVAGFTYFINVVHQAPGIAGLQLLDLDGTTVVESVSGSPGIVFIRWLAPASGDYYIDVFDQQNQVRGYSLQLVLEDEFGDDHLNATPITEGTYNAGLQFGGDLDYISFNALAGQTFRFTTSSAVETDTVMRLYSTNGTTVLAADDDGGPGLGSLITWTAPANGTYFVDVRGADQVTTGPYQFKMELLRDDVVGYDPTTGQWRIGISNGDVFTNNLGPVFSTAAGFETYVGDFNGDGLTDIAGRTDAGAWHVGINDGAGNYNLTVWGNWTADATAGWHDVTVADVNGDGCDDIIGIDSQNKFFVAVSNAISFNTTQWGSLGAGYVAHTVGDFNGDTYADVANLHSNGTWWVSESTGSTFVLDNYGSIQAQATADWRNIMSGDFNGDNIDDVLMQTGTGQWWIGDGRSATDGRFTVHFANRWNPNGYAQYHIGDFNGDGRDDLAGRTTTNQWWVNRSLTNGRMDARNWANSGIPHTILFTIGDFNGDGILDIATLRNNTDTWFVLKGTVGNVFAAEGYGLWTGWGNGGVASGRLN